MNFRNLVQNPFKLALFKLRDLPMGFMAGFKVKTLTDEKSQVTIKHNYFTKNPFKSMYFAAQSMAAEFSTATLVMDRIDKVRPRKISMLVLDMKANFSKKATGLITFTCEDGKRLDNIFQQVLETNDGYMIEMKTVGVDEQGDVVSTFHFTWTLKEKKPK